MVKDTRKRLLIAVENAGFDEAADLDKDSFSYLTLDILRSRLFRQLDELGFSSEYELTECDYDEHGNIVVVFLVCEQDAERLREVSDAHFKGVKRT